MSETIDIEWTSNEERELPNIGMSAKGRIFTMPYQKGKSYIDQKLAKEVKKSLPKKEGK